MKTGLDTSVVLGLLIGEPQRQAERAWQLVVQTRAAGGQVSVSDLVLSESYFALHHHYAVPKALALEQLAAFLASGVVASTGFAPEVLVDVKASAGNPGFVDRLIHAGYLRGGMDQMVTFERAAAKLAHTRVLRG